MVAACAGHRLTGTRPVHGQHGQVQGLTDREATTRPTLRVINPSQQFDSWCETAHSTACLFLMADLADFTLDDIDLRHLLHCVQCQLPDWGLV